MCFCLLDWKRLKTDVTPHLAAGLGGRTVRNGAVPLQGPWQGAPMSNRWNITHTPIPRLLSA